MQSKAYTDGSAFDCFSDLTIVKLCQVSVRDFRTLARRNYMGDTGVEFLV